MTNDKKNYNTSINTLDPFLLVLFILRLCNVVFF